MRKTTAWMWGCLKRKAEEDHSMDGGLPEEKGRGRPQHGWGAAWRERQRKTTAWMGGCLKRKAEEDHSMDGGLPEEKGRGRPQHGWGGCLKRKAEEDHSMDGGLPEEKGRGRPQHGWGAAWRERQRKTTAWMGGAAWRERQRKTTAWMGGCLKRKAEEDHSMDGGLPEEKGRGRPQHGWGAAWRDRQRKTTAWMGGCLKRKAEEEEEGERKDNNKSSRTVEWHRSHLYNRESRRRTRTIPHSLVVLGPNDGLLGKFFYQAICGIKGSARMCSLKWWKVLFDPPWAKKVIVRFAKDPFSVFLGRLWRWRHKAVTRNQTNARLVARLRTHWIDNVTRASP